MTDQLYLIAHKVRGEPAFDVATQMECPECNHLLKSGKINCAECDGEGFWWIIPTSGHRAYPWYSIELDNLGEEYNHSIRPGPMPPSLPDHYTARAAPRIDLATALGLRKAPAPPAPIVRRF